EYRKEIDDIRKEGYTRVRIDREMYDLSTDEPPDLDRYKQHWIDIVVDRLVVRPDVIKRLADSLETALKKGEGNVAVDIVAGADDGRSTIDDRTPESRPTTSAPAEQSSIVDRPSSTEMLFSEH